MGQGLRANRAGTEEIQKPLNRKYEIWVNTASPSGASSGAPMSCDQLESIYLEIKENCSPSVCLPKVII